MRTSDLPSTLRELQPALRIALAFSAAYLLLDQISFIYPLQELNITPWDPQAALAVALIYFRGRRWMPWIFLTVLVSEILLREIRIPLVGGFIIRWCSRAATH